MEEQTKQDSSTSSLEIKRDEDFVALYANSVISETSVWDLKVIFGLLDQSVVPNRIVQHTSINLPWIQVKLLSYWIQVQTAIHEHYNGKITIPQGVLPPNPATVDTPTTPQPLKDKVQVIYDKFMGDYKADHK